MQSKEYAARGGFCVQKWCCDLRAVVKALRKRFCVAFYGSGQFQFAYHHSKQRYFVPSLAIGTHLVVLVLVLGTHKHTTCFAMHAKNKNTWKMICLYAVDTCVFGIVPCAVVQTWFAKQNRIVATLAKANKAICLQPSNTYVPNKRESNPKSSAKQQIG